MLIMGAIFKNTQPDESDEERRELERYAHRPIHRRQTLICLPSMVAEAAAGKSKHHQLQAQARAAAKQKKHGSHSPPAAAPEAHKPEPPAGLP